MIVGDFIQHKVVAIEAKSTIQEAARKIVKQHLGVLPIVDEQGKPKGIVHLQDLLNLELPDFVQFVGDVDFVHDFGAVETTRPTTEMLMRSITTLMQPVITVDENCGLLRAYALMLQHRIFDIPVVNKSGKLVGIVSRVDIGTAILSQWSGVRTKKS